MGNRKKGAAVLLMVLAGLFCVFLKQYRQDRLQTGQETAETKEEAGETGEKKDFIKWVDFNVSYDALCDAYDYDVGSYDSETHVEWIPILAFLGTKYGGDFLDYRKKDMDNLVRQLTEEGKTMEELTESMRHYDYYLEAYTAVLGGLVGKYRVSEAQMNPGTVSGAAAGGTAVPEENSDPGGGMIRDGGVASGGGMIRDGGAASDGGITSGGGAASDGEIRYGLRAFSPIAKDFYYTDYDDFGVSRSYGYRRQHLGHDMMGQVGTPIIAVESGTVEALGWNQYGGWRIGIRSLDGKRYYYYAHLRKGYPYQSCLTEGCTVEAGEVIGYMGRTGYSTKEDTNNIDASHLHFGLQLIFDESQKKESDTFTGTEIWIDCYSLIRFLYKNRCETRKVEGTKEWEPVRRTVWVE